MTQTSEILRSPWQRVRTSNPKHIKRTRLLWREGQTKPIAAECRIDVEGTDFWVEWTEFKVAYLLERKFRIENPEAEVEPEKHELVWVPMDTPTATNIGVWRKPQSERNARNGHLTPQYEARGTAPKGRPKSVRGADGRFVPKVKPELV